MSHAKLGRHVVMPDVVVPDSRARGAACPVRGGGFDMIEQLGRHGADAPHL